MSIFHEIQMAIVHAATLRCLGMLIVLQVFCMLMWPWPDPRSRLWGFWTSKISKAVHAGVDDRQPPCLLSGLQIGCSP